MYLLFLIVTEVILHVVRVVKFGGLGREQIDSDHTLDGKLLILIRRSFNLQIKSQVFYRAASIATVLLL